MPTTEGFLLKVNFLKHDLHYSIYKLHVGLYVQIIWSW